ncbi:hypothetical protein TanjilG_26460 [Lupinus angustifolius]|uniref:Uncharacterized protein n=1 Tax=Lupinus angustifolius TaxID=3871 RepID=A0A1J7FMM8_LUPAN|nr:hypothetical protein TanjilG_26460 [Lupinus angustifolius]
MEDLRRHEPGPSRTSGTSLLITKQPEAKKKTTSRCYHYRVGTANSIPAKNGSLCQSHGDEDERIRRRHHESPSMEDLRHHEPGPSRTSGTSLLITKQPEAKKKTTSRCYHYRVGTTNSIPPKNGSLCQSHGDEDERIRRR